MELAIRETSDGDSEALKVRRSRPRVRPLMGDTRIHEARFLCTAEVAQPDGSTEEHSFFVTKQQFEMLGTVNLRPR